jgi:predicted dehydrogenase
VSVAKRLAVIGAGAMGAKHARVVAESEGARLDLVVDHDRTRARAVADQWGAGTSDDADAASHCHAAIVATSSETHVDIACRLLESGVPVLVEKPLATTLDGLSRLTTTARRTGTPLTCGFVERFNPAVQTLVDILDGPPVHLATQRYSPSNDRATTGVVDDLLIHDLDVVLQVCRGDGVVATDARTWTPEGGLWPETADALLQLRSGATATLSASRAHQRKIRALTVSTCSSTYEVDLLRRCITVYRNVVEAQLVDGVQSYRAQTVLDIPFVRSTGEPLALQLDHFLRLVADPSAALAELPGLVAPHEVALGITGATAVSPAAQGVAA